MSECCFTCAAVDERWFCNNPRCTRKDEECESVLEEYVEDMRDEYRKAFLEYIKDYD